MCLHHPRKDPRVVSDNFCDNVSMSALVVQKCHVWSYRCLNSVPLLEQEKNDSIQSQLDAVAFSSKRKQQKFGGLDKAFPISDSLSNLDTVPVSGKQQSSGE